MIKRYLSYFQMTIVSILLILVVAMSTFTTLDSYYGFYYEDKNYKEENTLAKITQIIIRFRPLQFFADYTGFNTGYGFFAPNVASDFVILFKVYDAQGKQVKVLENLPFATKEGFIRFSNVHSMYLDKLDDKTSIIWNRYLDVVLRQAALSVKRIYTIPDACVDAELYLYEFPETKEYKEGKRHRLIFIQNVKA